MRTLLLDIETAPSVGYTWGPKFEANIIEFIEPWYILSVAYKWLGEKTKVMALPDYPGYAPGATDRPLVADTVKILSEADVVIAHNGDKFDIRKINTRALIHRIDPPAPYKTIDTRKVAKAKYGFDSNSLNDLARQLGLGEKVHTGGFQLWKDCMAGDREAWGHMKEYNKHDVDLLEEVYLIMRPWITNHPTAALGEMACPKCGSAHIECRGEAVTLTARYQRYQCKDCGGWSRAVKREKPPEGSYFLTAQ